MADDYPPTDFNPFPKKTSTYRHDWDLGVTAGNVTAVNAMRILQDRPNDIFPFKVQGRKGETSIKLGSTYDLINTMLPFNNLGTGSDPVTVVEVTTLTFTFRTHKEHHRGEGQHITFECYDKLTLEDDDMTQRNHTFLAQYGTYVSSWKLPLHWAESIFNIGANIGATGAWWLQANNLKIALGVSDGTPRDVWWWRTQP